MEAKGPYISTTRRVAPSAHTPSGPHIPTHTRTICIHRVCRLPWGHTTRQLPIITHAVIILSSFTQGFHEEGGTRAPLRLWGKFLTGLLKSFLVHVPLSIYQKVAHQVKCSIFISEFVSFLRLLEILKILKSHFIYYYYFFLSASPCGMWDLSSWTRDLTNAPCRGSMES